jgi:hypothetical protein
MRASRSSFASACCSGLVAFGLAAGCRRAPVDAIVDGEAGAALPSASASTSTSEREVDAYVTAEPLGAKSIGHTSYVLKLTLEGGAVAVFKPRSKLPLGDHRYKGEIAAYRLARALGLDNVPRAIPRTFDAARLRALQGDFDQKGLVDADGRVRGALMPWIDKYRVLPLEEGESRARWEAWLFDAHSSVPEDSRALAASVSTMIAFDYVTANWDRWSGGNVAEDGASGKVLFVDNDGAFYEWPSPATLARQRAQLERVTRFSRRFVAALRALDARKLREALGEESPGVPLVSDRVVGGVDARRGAVLDVVDARVRDAGEGATLVFD